MDERNYLRQVIVARRDLRMPSGKLAAMVAHASMSFICEQLKWNGYVAAPYGTVYIPHGEFTPEQQQWLTEVEPDNKVKPSQISFAKIVLGVDSEAELKALIAKAYLLKIEYHDVIDSGHTINQPGTLVVAAFGPTTKERLAEVTGHLSTY
jgi:peptidyl-tRNA hydrolase